MYDPLHGQDKKHEARLPKPAGYARVLLHGAGHAGIQTIVGIGKHDALFDLLRCDILARAMRQAYRAGRSDGFRYLRILGSVLHEKNKPAAARFFEIAEQKGFHRLIKKWTPFYK